jgi:hypothetical protein
MYNDEFSQYLVESTSNYFDRYGMMYGENSIGDDDEFDAIVEGIIEDLLDDGYNVSECIDILEDLDDEDVEELFEAMLIEASDAYYASAAKTSQDNAARNKAARREKARAANVQMRKNRAERQKAERSASRQAKVSAVKGAVKGFLRKAKSKAVGAVAGAAMTASRKKADVQAAGQKVKSGILSKVSRAAQKVSNVAGRVAAKTAQQPTKKSVPASAGAIHRGVSTSTPKKPTASKTSSTKALPPAKESPRMAAAKQKLAKAATGSKARGTRFVGPEGQVASKRANTDIQGARQKFAKRIGLGEEFDVFDIVLDYILSEEYAVSYKDAYVIMNELDEETIDAILEESGYII